MNQDVKNKKSHYYKGSLLWNGLPVAARNSESLCEFKKHLKLIYTEYNDVVHLLYYACR